MLSLYNKYFINMSDVKKIDNVDKSYPLRVRNRNVNIKNLESNSLTESLISYMSLNDV